MQKMNYNFKLKDLELFCDSEICEKLNHLFGGNTDIDKHGMIKAMDTMRQRDRDWVLLYFLYIEREIKRRQKCYKIIKLLKYISLLIGFGAFILGIVFRMNEFVIYYMLGLFAVIGMLITDLWLRESISRKIIMNQSRV